MDVLSQVGFWAVTLGVPLALGAGVMRLLCGREMDGAAFVGWSWLVGTLGIGVVAWAWIACRVPLSVLPFVAGGFAVIALGAGFARRRDLAGVRRPRLPLLVVATCGAMLVLAADDALFSNGAPVTIGDEGNIWANRAMALHTAGALDDRYREFVTGGAPETELIEWFVFHPEYPPLNPLLQVWTFTAAGGIVHVENRVFIQTFALMLLVLLGSALARVAHPALAAFVLVLFATSRVAIDETTAALADAMVAFGLLAALDAAGRWRASGRGAHGFLFTLALSFLILTKQEGQMLAAVVAALTIPGLVRRFGFQPLTVLVIPAALWLAHAASNAHFGFASDLFVEQGGGSFLSRLREHGGPYLAAIGRETYATCIGVPIATNLLPPALLAVALAAPTRWWREQRFALTTILVASVAFTMVFLGTPHPIKWHVETALSRLVYQLLPVIAVCVAAGLQSSLAPRRRELAVA